MLDKQLLDVVWEEMVYRWQKGKDETWPDATISQEEFVWEGVRQPNKHAVLVHML